MMMLDNLSLSKRNTSKLLSVVFFLALFFLCIFPKYSQAEEFVLAIEFPNTEPYNYAISLLKLALNSGEEKHTLKIMVYPELSNHRIFDEMQTGDTPFNVVISGINKTRVAKSNIVKVPLSRGLLGHRLLVIKKQNLALLNSVNNLETLKNNISIGSGQSWIDTKILINAGFKVEVAPYEQLWKMLDKERFIGFNRGMHEAYLEVALYDKTYPELIVYPNIILKYKFDYFFYTKNDKLRSILEERLVGLYDNGLFMQHFHNHPEIKKAFKNLDYSHLHIYDFNNNFLPGMVKDIPRSYWHDIKPNKQSE